MKTIPITYGEQLHYSNAIKADRINVVFGSPKSDCRGRGICRIEPDVWDEATDPGCGFVPAHVEVDHFGRLQVHFLLDTLTSAQIDRQFTDGYFTVADRYELPYWLKETVGVADPHEVWAIAPRRYPLLVIDTIATVSFRLVAAAQGQLATTVPLSPRLLNAA